MSEPGNVIPNRDGRGFQLSDGWFNGNPMRRRISALKSKINILQMLAMLSLSAVIIDVSTRPINSEPLWRSSELVYTRPVTPREFKAVTAATPMVISDPAEEAFANSDDLYLAYHRLGWEAIRNQFYRGEIWEQNFDRYDFFEEYDLSKLSFRSSHDLACLAHFHGKKVCREQIGNLLQSRSQCQLRNSLAFSPSWRLVPVSFLALLSLVVLFLARVKEKA